MKKNFDLFLISKYRPLLMGLAIIMVVFHHLTIRVDSNVFARIYMFLRVTGAMGVDIFLFVSGIGLYKSFSKNENVKEFYCKRLIRIIPTYLLICLPYYAFKYLFISSPNLKEFFLNLFLITYFTKGDGDWFIAAIIILYFCFPLFYKVIKKYKLGMFILFLLWGIVTVAVYFLLPKLFHNTETFWPRIPIFIFGISIAKNVFEHKNICAKWIIVSIIINILSLAIEGYYCLKGSKVAYSFWPRLFYFLLSVTFILIVLYIVSYFDNFNFTKICKIISSLGGVTLEIYLLNQRLISKSVKILEKFLNENTSIYIGNFVGIVLTIIFAYIINIFINRILTKLKSKRNMSYERNCS